MVALLWSWPRCSFQARLMFLITARLDDVWANGMASQQSTAPGFTGDRDDLGCSHTKSRSSKSGLRNLSE
jgi:hypothetical protein